MQRVRIIAAVIMLTFAPGYGSAINAPRAPITRVYFTGTGTFTGACQSLSGIFVFRVKANFQGSNFVGGEVMSLAIHQVNDLDVNIPKENISLTAGSIAPGSTRADLRGSFVSPLNGGTYNFYIYGVTNGNVGAMETTGLCP